jgi:peptide/nickel transport system substrate-binding protein
MRNRFFTISALLLVICMGITACSSAPVLTSTPAGNTQSASGLAQPQTGGILNISAPVPANVGYPVDITSLGVFECMQPALETLFRFDTKFQAGPHLATGYTIASDSKSITITLRKGVKFHDGTDFNADAVKFNLELWRTSPRVELKAVSSIDVIDDYTVKLNLSQFDSFLIGNLAEIPGFMVSPTAIKTNNKDWAYKNAVGTGPFKQIALQSTQSVSFTKFDGYWQKGKPYLDGIKYINIPDATVASASLQKGEIDVYAVFVADSKIASDLQKMGGYNVFAKKARALILIPDSASKDSPWGNLAVRQAAAYSIDFKTICPIASNGLGEYTNQLAPQGSVFYNNSIVGYPFDPQKAKGLLASAGFSNGFNTDIYFSGSPNDPAMTAVQSYLSKMGINATLQVRDIGPYIALRPKGWQNGLYADIIDASPEREPAKILSSYFSDKSPNFPNVIKPDEYLAVLNKITVEPNYDARVKLQQEMTKLLIDKYCITIPGYMIGRAYATSKKVHDYGIEEYWLHQWTPENTWLSK